MATAKFLDILIRDNKNYMVFINYCSELEYE